MNRLGPTGEMQEADPRGIPADRISAAAWWALAMAGFGWMFESYDSFMLSLTLPALTAGTAARVCRLDFVAG